MTSEQLENPESREQKSEAWASFSACLSLSWFQFETCNCIFFSPIQAQILAFLSVGLCIIWALIWTETDTEPFESRFEFYLIIFERSPVQSLMLSTRISLNRVHVFKSHSGVGLSLIRMQVWVSFGFRSESYSGACFRVSFGCKFSSLLQLQVFMAHLGASFQVSFKFESHSGSRLSLIRVQVF